MNIAHVSALEEQAAQMMPDTIKPEDLERQKLLDSNVVFRGVNWGMSVYDSVPGFFRALGGTTSYPGASGGFHFRIKVEVFFFSK